MSKKIKVLHLLTSNIYSGAENVACSIIDNSSDIYEMVYCSPNGTITQTLREKNIEYIELEKCNKKGLEKVINNYKPDYIHAHDIRASILAGMFNKTCRIISHIHKNDPKMSKMSIKSILYFFFLKRFYKIVGVSDSVYDEFIFKNKIKNKYITIPNYIDKDMVIKKSNEFKADKKYDLFYFGRLSDEKNPLEFIEIINQLNDRNIKCIMIGDGPLRKNCEDKIKEYNLENNIEMVGFQSNPYPYIKASKIGIMPSKFEGFGLTAIEASILEKPVLNSGVGGLKTIFKDYPDCICNSIPEYLKNIQSSLKYYNINYLNLVTNKNLYINSINNLYK